MGHNNKSLIVNLSMVIDKPTGITNYINNILPHFDSLPYKSLVPKKYTQQNLIQNPHYISGKLNPDYGSRGHLFRLTWTQLKLPKIYRKLQGNLLFSPVPEIPLYAKCRSVIMVHDLIPLRFPKNTSALTNYSRYYLPLVCQQATHIICNSQATADDLVKFFGISAQKITPILLGYNRQKFRVIQGLQNQNKCPYFFYLGRHDHYKNVARIISAFAQFKYHNDYELWLAGPNDSRYTPNLQQQAQDLGIDTRVKFLSYVADEDLPVVINQAHALIFPSLWEGFGFPVLEAIACGTPVITSNISSLPEVAGEAALLVDPYDVKDIVEAMNRISKDDQLRQQLIQLGLERAQKFSWEKTATETMQVLANFL